MKLIIQIPCFNEALTLPLVFRDMPRRIEGIDEIEFLIIDDGSTDETARVARSLGVKHIVRIPGANRRWLGRAFKAGADFAIQNGADILVNTDGDNQYPSSQIPELIKPLLDGSADIVIGDRHPGSFHEFSPLKRLLQRAGNLSVKLLAGEPARDAVSGFRAYSRHALMQLNVITNYTYTVDTLIQSYKKGLDVSWIDVTPNPKTRNSRLITGVWSKCGKSGMNILRLISVYEPFRFFLGAALVFFIPSAILLGRFAYFFLFDHAEAAGHIQSVIIGGALLVIAVTLAVFSVIAGLLSVNRILLEDVLLRLKRLESPADEHTEAPPKAVRGSKIANS